MKKKYQAGMDGLSWGHITQEHVGTGVTSFLFDQPAACGCFLLGSALAERDITLLSPDATIAKIDALVFSGGSAFGLGAANGVMQWLYEQGRGYETGAANVPIVPTACLYDLDVKSVAYPDPKDAYTACQRAQREHHLCGQVGVATGASVGKGIDGCEPMPGGFGFAQVGNEDGVEVLACVAVNSVGDVVDEKGHIVAGARLRNGRFAHIANCLRMGNPLQLHAATNTTLVAVFTNASMDKMQLSRVAKMATAGIARAIVPAFTAYDGDMVFAVSLGQQHCDEMVLGTMAADVVRTAIVRAVT